VTPPETAFLFDLDGTLVDSVYDHVLAWHDALVAEGIELSFWRIHRKIGMSGGLFTNMLLRETGFPISEERIDRLQRLHAEFYSKRSGMIIQFSTGGRSGKGSERGGMLGLKPDMASLATGSCNFPAIIYENPPTLIRDLAEKMRDNGVKPEIEVFDLSMLYQAIELAKEGIIRPPLHVQFVFGVKNAMPALRDVLEFEIGQLRKLMPQASWTAAGIGRHQLEVNRWCLELGGHCRTGLEDNVRWDKERLAPSNAALVKRVAELCAEYGRHPASVGEARSLLSLPPVSAT